MYKHIKTYLLIVATVILTIYFTVYSSSIAASKYEDKAYISVQDEAINQLQDSHELALNFSIPIHPVKAIKPETVVTHVSERTRLVFNLLSLGILYFIFKSKSHLKIALSGYYKSFSIPIPIFILFKKLII